MRANVAQTKAGSRRHSDVQPIGGPHSSSSHGGIAQSATEGQTVRRIARMQPIVSDDVAEARRHRGRRNRGTAPRNLTGPEPIRMDDLVGGCLRRSATNEKDYGCPRAATYARRLNDKSSSTAAEHAASDRSGDCRSRSVNSQGNLHYAEPRRMGRGRGGGNGPKARQGAVVPTLRRGRLRRLPGDELRRGGCEEEAQTWKAPPHPRDPVT